MSIYLKITLKEDYCPFRLLYREYEEAIGGIREDFFAEAMRMKGYQLDYLKTKRGAKTPDFLVNLGSKSIIVEIGGKGKGRLQFKGIESENIDKIILTDSTQLKGIRRPLFLVGLL